MKKKIILITSGVGLMIIGIVAIALFFILSSNPTPTNNQNLYKDTIFLSKLNSTPFPYSLGSNVLSPSLINTSSLPLYKYSVATPIDFKSQLISKYKIVSKDNSTITYDIDKNTSVMLDKEFIKFNFNIAKQSDVFGFSNPDVNVKKAFDYLKTQGLELDPADYITQEYYYSTGAGEYALSNKTSGDVQSLTLFYKLKDFSYIYNSNAGFMSLMFNKANDLLSISINTNPINKYTIESTSLYLEYLDLNKEVLTTDFITKNGIFLPYYPTSKNIVLTSIEYVYLPSKDGYLIPFVRLSDSIGANELLLPIVNPSRIIYGS